MTPLWVWVVIGISSLVCVVFTVLARQNEKRLKAIKKELEKLLA